MTQRSEKTNLHVNDIGSSPNLKSKLGKTQPINVHVITLINFLALLPLVYFIPDIVEPFLPAIKWLNVMVTVGIIVPIISYIIMPITHIIFSKN